jgi:DNA-binding MarR family transcriptional regulator
MTSIITPVTSALPAPSTPDARAAEIVDALTPLLAHHRRRWAARCHAHGISILGFQVLSLLEMHDALPMSHLAEELDVALPNATGIVNRMEERGFVVRRDDPTDRRVVRVEMTDAGRRMISEMEAGRRERMLRLFGILDEAQQRRLLQAVRDLRAAAATIALSEEGDA